jgi:hypothetical protein
VEEEVTEFDKLRAEFDAYKKGDDNA